MAKRILGPDFISPEEIAQSRGLAYTKMQLEKIRDTLPAPNILRWWRGSGIILVAGPPRRMSLLDIRSMKSDYFRPMMRDGWYTEAAQKFARADKSETIWIALSKEPVEGSLDKNWAEQSDLVDESMEVPNAAEVTWCLTTYRAVRDTYLLPTRCVRTSSVDSDGDHVYVGQFGAIGLEVNAYLNARHNSILGVSAARKF
ncbi:MAG: hypothetical protein KGH56_01245 [Patescibacteria group bacterium]|nr:hypothetical protein [Patescibacteria group bacterium]